MPPRRSSAVLPPNLGLYLGMNPYTVPPRAVVDGMNFRVKNGRIQKRNMGWAPFFPTGQENTSDCKVLLHFDGNDAGTLIYDSAAGKTANKAWVVAGNAHTDTAQAAFGPSSLLCDGTGDWVTHADHADFTLGTTATIEMRFMCNATTGTTEKLAGQADSTLDATVSAWYAERHTDDTIRFHLSNGTTFTTVATTDTFVQGHDFAHLRAVLSGGTLYLFSNGELQDSAAFAGTPNDSAEDLRIGAAGEDTSDPWTGWIDEFAIWSTALSTEDFTPPTGPYNTPLEGSNGAFTGPAMFSDRFITRDAGEHILFFTDRNIYRLITDQNRVVLMNPAVVSGTVSVSGAVVTSDGSTAEWVDDGVVAGDKISFGSATQNDPGAQWYTIQSVDTEDQLTLTESPAETVSTAAYTIRRMFTGATDDIWDTETFVAPDDGVGDDLYFVTNGVDPICTWDASDTFFTSREALGFTCKFLAVYKNMMLYANITETGGDFLPTDFINSDVGIPLEVGLGLAGQFRVHDGPDHIRNIEDLGDNMVFYAERTIVHMQFVGEPLVFIFREASSGVGLIASRLLADYGDYHEFVGHDSLYKFDGVSVQEIGKQLWREILRLRDPVRHEMSFCHFDEEQGELHFVIALTSDAGVGIEGATPEISYVEHYLEEVGEQTPIPFSRRSMPFNGGGYGTVSGVLTWADLTDVWSSYGFKWNDSFLFSAFPLNLMCGADGRIYTINIVTTANGDDLPSFVTFPRRLIAPGNGYAQGLVTRVYPFIVEGTGTMMVETRYYDHPEGSISRSQDDEFDMTLPQEGHFVAPYRKGRAFDCKFATDTADYEMGGYDTEIKLEGRR